MRPADQAAGSADPRRASPAPLERRPASRKGEVRPGCYDPVHTTRSFSTTCGKLWHKRTLVALAALTSKSRSGSSGRSETASLVSHFFTLGGEAPIMPQAMVGIRPP